MHADSLRGFVARGVGALTGALAATLAAALGTNCVDGKVLFW